MVVVRVRATPSDLLFSGSPLHCTPLHLHRDIFNETKGFRKIIDLLILIDQLNLLQPSDLFPLSLYSALPGLDCNYGRLWGQLEVGGSSNRTSSKWKDCNLASIIRVAWSRFCCLEWPTALTFHISLPVE